VTPPATHQHGAQARQQVEDARRLRNWCRRFGRVRPRDRRRPAYTGWAGALRVSDSASVVREPEDAAVGHEGKEGEIVDHQVFEIIGRCPGPTGCQQIPCREDDVVAEQKGIEAEIDPGRIAAGIGRERDGPRSGHTIADDIDTVAEGGGLGRPHRSCDDEDGRDEGSACGGDVDQNQTSPPVEGQFSRHSSHVNETRHFSSTTCLALARAKDKPTLGETDCRIPRSGQETRRVELRGLRPAVVGTRSARRLDEATDGVDVA